MKFKKAECHLQKNEDLLKHVTLSAACEQTNTKKDMLSSKRCSPLTYVYLARDTPPRVERDDSTH
jgi:hypothetical protein